MTTNEVTHLPVRTNTGIRLYLTTEAEIKAKIDEVDRNIDDLRRQATQLAEAKMKADQEHARLLTQLNAARLARRHIEDSEK
jgi:hypothetical protein